MIDLGWFRRFKGCQAASTVIEFAIVAPIVAVLALGIAEFGRALNIRNQLSLVADEGARLILTNKSIPDATLEASMRAGLVIGPSSQVTVTMGTATVGGAAFRTITLLCPFVPSTAGIFKVPINLVVSRRIPLV